MCMLWLYNLYLLRIMYILDRLSLVKGKETGNGFHSKIDHDCYLCVDATEVCMYLYK
jgi:hypothetical protein